MVGIQYDNFVLIVLFLLTYKSIAAIVVERNLLQIV